MQELMISLVRFVHASMRSFAVRSHTAVRAMVAAVRAMVAAFLSTRAGLGLLRRCLRLGGCS